VNVEAPAVTRPDSSTATLVSLFAHRVEQDGDRVALHVRTADHWQSLRWSKLADDAARLATLLAELGVSPGDRVAQFSPNRYEWILADLAIQLARAVHVPIHASLAAPQVAYQVADSGARLVLLATPEDARKLSTHYRQHPAELASDVHFVCYERLTEQANSELADAAAGLPAPFHVSALGDLFARADARDPLALRQHGQRLMREARDALRSSDLATILYTSGTTGEPKGVMLSHGNLASNALGTLEAFGHQPDDLRLAWLPMSHIFARTCDVYTWLAGGGELALAEKPESVTDNCRELHPTLINGVPYFFEKVRRFLVDRGLADQPGVLPAVFGGRLRAANSGGAPLPEHVARFYNDRGVFLGEGYGLTESSPVISASTPGALKIGAAGRPIPGVTVKIAADGEILTRGPHVMLGYWKQPAATAEVLCDGWLRTGDLGKLDADGFLHITGRKKDLIVTSAGKNIAPAYLEALLKSDPLIEQAVVIGDRRNYLVALIVPNRDALLPQLAALGIGDAFGEALRQPAVVDLYAGRIRERLVGVSRFEQIGRFALLDRSLSAERGEVTLTMKLRREAIHRNFADVIERLYAES
jgi:long-chain acyl-CoA synthetase